VPSEARAVGPWATWPPGYGSGDEDRRSLFVLSALRGISPRSLIRIAAERGSAAATLAWIREGHAGSENDQAFARGLDPDAIARAAEACGSRLVTWASAEYPSQLRQIPDPPGAIYLIGRAPPDVTSAVAVVGARRCTASGREAADRIGRGLALAGLTVALALQPAPRAALILYFTLALALWVWYRPDLPALSQALRRAREAG